MKLLTVTLLLCIILYVRAQNKYTNKYDNVNVDQILTNNRVLSNYIKCLMEEGPCTPDGRELKKTLPDALSSECLKCNEKQKETAEKVIRHLMKNRPNDWERLSKKYDPNMEYKKKFDKKL
ncbi:PREDICTED: ejaculatory bulb-specific protein 3-like [Nicrophorus vespilloides]|uniref:Ejaculatory bulb-specific protein 3-like n=1 Tax=Nicrophorus vespilloides TaxID=110193 RepID=A0ABM1MYK8_NICVS|nr:PREDICTED: ejaculatory bulb-specific protein 3-like [Nicrophorus vespilloides]